MDRDIAAVLILCLFLALWSVARADLLTERGGLDCPDSKTHRVVCESKRDVLMTCPKWAALVHNSQSLGPQRALMVLKNLIGDRHPQEQRYIMLFAQDASQFVINHRFKNPEQAYAMAMQACGSWAQG